MRVRYTDGQFRQLPADSSVIELEVALVGAGAVLFRSPDGESEEWIPKSLIYRGVESCHKGETVIVEIYDWKLKELGW